VRANRYWDLDEQKHHGTAIGERIAWHRANAGLPGECEGFIPCAMAVSVMTNGRYLDLYPSGAHVDEALQRLDYPLLEIVKPDTPYTMNSWDRKELQESISTLIRILERTSSSLKDEVLSRLRLIDRTYR
jgi:hypothetical protein